MLLRGQSLETSSKPSARSYSVEFLCIVLLWPPAPWSPGRPLLLLTVPPVVHGLRTVRTTLTLRRQFPQTKAWGTRFTPIPAAATRMHDTLLRRSPPGGHIWTGHFFSLFLPGVVFKWSANRFYFIIFCMTQAVGLRWMWLVSGPVCLYIIYIQYKNMLTVYILLFLMYKRYI